MQQQGPSPWIDLSLSHAQPCPHCTQHATDGGDQLASEFAAHINQLALKAPLQHRRPSPLEPPTAAVAAQMDALQINDWPEPDAGVHTAVGGSRAGQGRAGEQAYTPAACVHLPLGDTTAQLQCAPAHCMHVAFMVVPQQAQAVQQMAAAARTRPPETGACSHDSLQSQSQHAAAEVWAAITCTLPRMLTQPNHSGLRPLSPTPPHPHAHTHGFQLVPCLHA